MVEWVVGCGVECGCGGCDVGVGVGGGNGGVEVRRW